MALGRGAAARGRASHGASRLNVGKEAIYVLSVEHWESYVLGAFGILLMVGLVVLQTVALVNGHTWSVLPFSLGVLIGAVLYGAGFRLLSR